VYILFYSLNWLFWCDFYMWNDKSDEYLIPARNPMGTSMSMNFYPRICVHVWISTCSLFTNGWVIGLPDPNPTVTIPNYACVFRSVNKILFCNVPLFSYKIFFCNCKILAKVVAMIIVSLSSCYVRDFTRVFYACVAMIIVSTRSCYVRDFLTWVFVRCLHFCLVALHFSWTYCFHLTRHDSWIYHVS
jgi:hypothetical protein